MSVFQWLKCSRSFRAFFFVFFAGFFVLVPEYGGVYASSWAEDTIGILVAKLLFGIYQLFSLFVSIAAKMFLWVIDVNVFTKLLNDGAIYEVWSVVRDFCNIFFILVLLFSAFATIFQLDKYEYKKTIPLLIIMALLVNFSFPISRFVIDLANVPMYFFAQSTFGVSANDITSGVLSESKIQNIMLPGSADAGKTGESYEIVQLLAAIICMALFGISFLVLAILLLVRMIALAILVMFSPIGFVGMITPALHKFARDWWERLFKWAFYGPISVLLVLVAIIVMQAAEKAHGIQPMQNLGGSQTLSDYTASIAFFAIPIVLFWIAITSAEKYSNDMSGLGIKWGSNFGRKMGGWMRRGTIGAAGGLAGYTWKQSGIPGGAKNWWNNRTGWFSPKASERFRESAEAGVGGVLSRDMKGAMNAVERKRVNEQIETYKKANKPYKELMAAVNKGSLPGAKSSDVINAKAAALTLSEKEMFENTDDFSTALKLVGNDMDSVSKMVRKAPKEILQSSNDFVKALAAVDGATSGMGDQMKAQVKKQMIEKADGGTLATINGSQYGSILSSLGTDAGLIGSFDAKIKKEGKMKVRIDYETGKRRNSAGVLMTRGEVINELLGKENAGNLGKQSGLMDDADFQKFFKDKLSRNDFDARDLQKYLENYSGDGNRANFKNAVV